MLYESKVISAVCDYLERSGWDIQQKKSVHEPGDDIVATRDRVELRIEAKGESSEKPHTARYGKSFTKNQVKSHVAMAFYRAASMRSESVTVAMAFPDTHFHREMIRKITPELDELRIDCFWVTREGTVRQQSMKAVNELDQKSSDTDGTFLNDCRCSF